MPTFAYKAVDSAGVRTAGTLQAETLAEAERRLVQTDATILSLAPAAGGAGAKERAAPGPARTFGRKVSAGDAADVLKNLAVMAETGVPFVEALESILSSAKTGTIEAGLARVRDAVVAGQSLSGAMRVAPEMFPPLVTDMVRIAESGGRLDAALDSGAVYLERIAEMRKKVVNAMMYPCVMLGVSFLTMAILIVFVMPKFAVMFKSMKTELPWTTKAMLSAGDAVRGNPLGSLLVVGAVLVGGVLLFRLPAGKVVVAAVAGRTPLLGELLRRLALSRALQSIATLANAGVPLLHAIEHGARVAGPGRTGRALLAARDSVERGSALSDALTATGAFPRTLVQMVAVGERTGRLAPLLTRLAQGMESDVDARLRALVATIEPLMIVVMGVVVGGITVSIIGPIYSVVENVK